MKFSTNEKKALAGMAAILAFGIASIYQIGMRNFWFEAQNTYYTKVRDADGLRVGSVVTIRGLRVGQVSALDVADNDEILVTFKVKTKEAERVRTDSQAIVFRSFIIGEKRIDLLPGSPDQPAIANGGTIPGRDTIDLAEFVTGKKLGELMGQVDTIVSGLGMVLGELKTVFGKYHSGQFEKTLGMIDPALANFLKLSDDLIVVTKELKKQPKALPQTLDAANKLLVEANGDLFSNDLLKSTLGKVDHVMAPVAEKQKLIESLLGNLEDFSKELKKNPEFTKEILAAVKELTITLKALQKTWILKDETQEVKDGK